MRCFGIIKNAEEFFDCPLVDVNSYVLRIFLTSTSRKYLQKGRKGFDAFPHYNSDTVGSEHFTIARYDDDISWFENIVKNDIHDWALSVDKFPGTVFFWFKNREDLTILQLSSS